jgi:PAS domain S-box-containing protein
MKLTEEQQYWERDFVTDLLKQLPLFVFWKDKNCVYLGCNDLFAHAAGLSSSAEIIGKTDYDLPWTKEQSDAYRADDQDVMKSKKSKLDIEEPQTLHGKHIVLLTNKVPLLNRKGEVIGVLGVYSDITNRKNMEIDLLNAKKSAEESSRAKTEFLENMRHDLRTPLTGIVGFADIIKEEARDPKIKEYADNLAASSYALLDMLNEVLETIHLTSGEIPLLKKKFSLKQKIEDVVNLNLAKAKQKGLELQFDVDSCLPNYFIGDYKRIQRIVLELVANALNFTDKGYVKVSLKVAGDKNNHIIIEIIVEDTGIGIPPEKQNEIFTRFTRLSPSYEGIYRGTGLGLSIVKQFIDDVEGEIYVTSQKDEGSIFRCTIPLRKALLDTTFDVDTTQIQASRRREAAIATVNTKIAQASAESTLSRILLVEDNAIAQKMAAHVISNLGCEVASAADGKTALMLADQEQYDLIFMDIGLPDLDGYEVTRRIRLSEWNKDLHVPIIALTAHVDSENKQRCIEIGMDAVLSKPLSKETAKDILDAFIPSRSKPTPIETNNSSELKVEVEEEVLFSLSGKVIDREKGLEAAGNREDLFHELLAMMRDSMSEEMQILMMAHKANDWKKIRSLVHKLNGGACVCGAMRLREACVNLENYLRSDNLELAERLYQQVFNEMEAFMQGVSELKF